MHFSSSASNSCAGRSLIPIGHRPALSFKRECFSFRSRWWRSKAHGKVANPQLQHAAPSLIKAFPRRSSLCLLLIFEVVNNIFAIEITPGTWDQKPGRDGVGGKRAKTGIRSDHGPRVRVEFARLSISVE